MPIARLMAAILKQERAQEPPFVISYNQDTAVLQLIIVDAFVSSAESFESFK